MSRSQLHPRQRILKYTTNNQQGIFFKKIHPIGLFFFFFFLFSFSFFFFSVFFFFSGNKQLLNKDQYTAKRIKKHSEGKEGKGRVKKKKDALLDAKMGNPFRTRVRTVLVGWCLCLHAGNNNAGMVNFSMLLSLLLQLLSTLFI